MELDVKEQQARLKVEAHQIAEQLGVVLEQMNRLQETRQSLINAGLKNQGALELLQNLNGEKPNGKQ